MKLVPFLLVLAVFLVGFVLGSLSVYSSTCGFLSNESEGFCSVLRPDFNFSLSADCFDCQVLVDFIGNQTGNVTYFVVNNVTNNITRNVFNVVMANNSGSVVYVNGSSFNSGLYYTSAQVRDLFAQKSDFDAVVRRVDWLDGQVKFFQNGSLDALKENNRHLEAMAVRQVSNLTEARVLELMKANPQVITAVPSVNRQPFMIFGINGYVVLAVGGLVGYFLFKDRLQPKAVVPSAEQSRFLSDVRELDDLGTLGKGGNEDGNAG